MKKLVKESLVKESEYSNEKITILTIKDLKEVIKNLPDDMDVMGYNGGNGDLFRIGHWILEKDNEYPIGAFVISVD